MAESKCKGSAAKDKSSADRRVETKANHKRDAVDPSSRGASQVKRETTGRATRNSIAVKLSASKSQVKAAGKTIKAAARRTTIEKYQSPSKGDSSNRAGRKLENERGLKRAQSPKKAADKNRLDLEASSVTESEQESDTMYIDAPMTAAVPSRRNKGSLDLHS